MSHRTKELLDLDSVTWSVPSSDMNPVISSALTPTSYTTELPGRLGLRLKHPLCVGKFRHRFLQAGLCFTRGQFSSGWFASSPICCCGLTHTARGLFSTSYSSACQSPVPVANTIALKQPGTVLHSCYRKIHPFHPQRTRMAFNSLLSQRHS